MNSRQGGFTLIELMLAVAISSIVGVTFFGVMYMQTMNYVQRLDELDAHSNARAALNVMRRYVRNARWGMVSGSNGVGTVGIGKCFLDASPSQSNGSCNNLVTDSGADRLRVVYIVNDTEYVGSQKFGSANNCSSNVLDTATQVHVNQNPVRAFAPGTILGLGGNCAGSSTPASDIMVYTSDSGSGAGCAHRYGYTMLEGASLSCTAGYDVGFNFGRAVVADFYIYKDAQGRPQLMMRTDPTKAPSAGFVVAYDVEDLQVRYGIDTTYPSDRTVDVWCDDPRISSDGGSGLCDTKQNNTGTAYGTLDNYNRIIAAQITLRVRTDNPRPNLNTFPLDGNFLVANPVANVNDGYQRWIYSTTIALRNDNI